MAYATHQEFFHPLGCNPNFCVNREVTLVLRDNLFSLHDSYVIGDDRGSYILGCKSRPLAFGHRKEFFDKRGRYLFSLRERPMTMMETFYAQDANGTEFLEVKSKWHLGDTRITATFLNTSTHRLTELAVKGDWHTRKATITLGSAVVAQISRRRPRSSGHLVAEPNYFVTVAPNVDLSLVAAVCISLDEKEKEETRRTSTVNL
ncbi:tubby C-terminal-like domain-containing protein [Xylogone sp. PMI_703]|nr:tubby C-terminal-like domain-containing protein [Xylogone sp. PMI_703]